MNNLLHRLLQVAWFFALLKSFVKAENSTKRSFESYQISQSDGPYTIKVLIPNEDAEIPFVIDADKYIAMNGTCSLNFSVYFTFPCPVECSQHGCFLYIKLPEVSFMEQLVVETNETHFEVYYHQRKVCGSRRPVFTQQCGPFIFTTFLPRTPVYVLLDEKNFVVEANEGICRAENSTEAFKCNVETLGEFSRITVFLPEIENIKEISLGAEGSDMVDGIYWISVERISHALSDTRIFTYESENLSSCTNEEKVELVWRLQGTPSGINVTNVKCYSNEEDICDNSSPCVLEKEGNYSVLKFEAFKGRENIVFFTCEYEDEEKFDLVTYRHIWPGLQAFEGNNKDFHTYLNDVELQWIVKSWSPSHHRILDCSIDGRFLCSGTTTTFEEGKCQVEEAGDLLVFTVHVERIGDTDKTIFICTATDDAQTQTVYWHGTLNATFSEYIPETTILVEGLALANALQDYLKNVRITFKRVNKLLRMAPYATFKMTCSIDGRNMSWLCEVHFKEAKIHLLKRRGTRTKVTAGILNGKTYRISGKYKLCEYNINTMDSLETTNITLVNSTILNEEHDERPKNRAPTTALTYMLSKGPTAVCRGPS